MRSLLARWRNIIALRRIRNSYCAIRERVIVSSRQVNSRVNSRTKGGLSHLAFVRHLVGHCRNLECQRQLRCLSQYVIWWLGGALFLEPISLTDHSFASKSDLISAYAPPWFHSMGLTYRWNDFSLSLSFLWRVSYSLLLRRYHGADGRCRCISSSSTLPRVTIGGLCPLVS